jgi:hypothetical protein
MRRRLDRRISRRTKVMFSVTYVGWLILTLVVGYFVIRILGS